MKWNCFKMAVGTTVGLPGSLKVRSLIWLVVPLTPLLAAPSVPTPFLIASGIREGAMAADCPSGGSM